MNKDLISRSALMNESHWIIQSDGKRVYVVHIEDVGEAPSVDAEIVRHGKWEERKRDGDSRWVCSECEDVEFSSKPLIKYCPNCGAKMDLGCTKISGLANACLGIYNK